MKDAEYCPQQGAALEASSHFFSAIVGAYAELRTLCTWAELHSKERTRNTDAEMVKNPNLRLCKEPDRRTSSPLDKDREGQGLVNAADKLRKRAVRPRCTRALD